MQTVKTPTLYHINKDTVELDPHPGQARALDSEARFVVVLAGTQGGKTTLGPWWLLNEIVKRGPGDYLVVTPTYPLLNLKALPEFLNVFQTILKLGSHRKADKVFQFDALGEIKTFGQEQETITRVLFGYATDPESLESATAKAAWLDEAGQNKFKLASFEAIMRRLSLAQGRVLITTTPYNLGWIKQNFWDKRNGRSDIDVIRFDSTQNPSFPIEEMERARRDLPRWKFDMFYRAIFTRPAGMIYDIFDETIHKVRPFAIPEHWPRYLGLDFGGVNTAGVFVAHDIKNDLYYAYREYLTGGKTAGQHAKDLMKHETKNPIAYGGARSEVQWRREFQVGGLAVRQPSVWDVEVGLDRGYALLLNLRIFDTCAGLLDEFGTYSRELDDMGEPTEKIADKNTFHLLDAYRYIACQLAGGTPVITGETENPFY